MYILLDDGTLTNKLSSLINARGGNNVISASVSLENIPGEPVSKSGGRDIVLFLLSLSLSLPFSFVLFLLSDFEGSHKL